MTVTPLWKIQDAADAAQEATKKRDAYIRTAHAQGISLRVLAEAAGVSHQTIANICREEQA